MAGKAPRRHTICHDSKYGSAMAPQRILVSEFYDQDVRTRGSGVVFVPEKRGLKHP